MGTWCCIAMGTSTVLPRHWTCIKSPRRSSLSLPRLSASRDPSDQGIRSFSCHAHTFGGPRLSPAPQVLRDHPPLDHGLEQLGWWELGINATDTSTSLSTCFNCFLQLLDSKAPCRCMIAGTMWHLLSNTTGTSSILSESCTISTSLKSCTSRSVTNGTSTTSLNLL